MEQGNLGYCHPEQREASRDGRAGILRAAQGDMS